MHRMDIDKHHYRMDIIIIIDKQFVIDWTLINKDKSECEKMLLCTCEKQSPDQPMHLLSTIGSQQLRKSRKNIDKF